MSDALPYAACAESRPEDGSSADAPPPPRAGGSDGSADAADELPARCPIPADDLPEERPDERRAAAAASGDGGTDGGVDEDDELTDARGPFGERAGDRRVRPPPSSSDGSRLSSETLCINGTPATRGLPAAAAAAAAPAAPALGAHRRRARDGRGGGAAAQDDARSSPPRSRFALLRVPPPLAPAPLRRSPCWRRRLGGVGGGGGGRVGRLLRVGGGGRERRGRGVRVVFGVEGGGRDLEINLIEHAAHLAADARHDAHELALLLLALGERLGVETPETRGFSIWASAACCSKMAAAFNASAAM